MAAGRQLEAGTVLVPAASVITIASPPARTGPKSLDSACDVLVYPQTFSTTLAPAK